MGIAFTNMEITKPIYPAIGLRTPGEQVTANFGHEPFVFDIAQYVRVSIVISLLKLTAKILMFICRIKKSASLVKLQSQ